jgi:hypothetical protein
MARGLVVLSPMIAAVYLYFFLTFLLPAPVRCPGLMCWHWRVRLSWPPGRALARCPATCERGC